MYVMMPVNVIGKACGMCSRLKVIVETEYSRDKVTAQNLECAYYNECLHALDMYQRSQAERETEN